MRSSAALACACAGVELLPSVEGPRHARGDLWIERIERESPDRRGTGSRHVGGMKA